MQRWQGHLRPHINKYQSSLSVQCGVCPSTGNAKRLATTCTYCPKFAKDLTIDERRIRQVLINLLNNAVKFTSEGGSINLEMTLESAIAPNESSITHWVDFAVIDTGIGISSEKKHFFSPLFKSIAP